MYRFEYDITEQEYMQFNIYFSPVMAYVVPFRIIQNNIDINEFKAFLKSKTGLTFK